MKYLDFRVYEVPMNGLLTTFYTLPWDSGETLGKLCPAHEMNPEERSTKATNNKYLWPNFPMCQKEGYSRQICIYILPDTHRKYCSEI